MALRDTDVKETLTNRPTTIAGFLLFLAVFLFFIDDVLILTLLFILNPVFGVIALIVILAVWAWRNDHI